MNLKYTAIDFSSCVLQIMYRDCAYVIESSFVTDPVY